MLADSPESSLSELVMVDKVLLLLAMLVVPAAVTAEINEKTLRYKLDGTAFEGTLVWQGDAEAKPAILMIPNWMGPTEASLRKAKRIAGDQYVVFMADMYGVNVRPENASEASEAAGAVRADRAMMRARAAKALAVLRQQEHAPVLRDEVAAIGFCFGGGTVLELARSGADVDAVVSFHGDLMSPTLAEDSDRITASVLVLHGADDPYVPQEHVREFIGVMQDTEVDWQLIQYGNTVHSFTDPNADAKGKADYHPASARRAFAAAEQLFSSLW